MTPRAPSSVKRQPSGLDNGWEVFATDPCCDEQLAAAVSGEISPLTQMAARNTSVMSCAGRAALKPAGGGRAEHGDGLAASTFQPDGIGTLLRPFRADRSNLSTAIRGSGMNRCASRLDNDSRMTFSLNTICSDEPT